jgi:hypothetical protein
LLAKTHPNPKSEVIEKISSEIQNGELSRVLDLLYYALNDESEDEYDTNILRLHSQSSIIKLSEKNNALSLYDLSSYKNTEANLSFEKAIFSFPISKNFRYFTL